MKSNETKVFQFMFHLQTTEKQYTYGETSIGTNGQNGTDGKDGNTPFIGENGNWWIGTTDTGVKATGVDGEKGDKGDTGEKGEKGDKGEGQYSGNKILFRQLREGSQRGFDRGAPLYGR